MSEVPALIVWSVFPLGGKVNKGSGQRRSPARFRCRNFITIMQIDPEHPSPVRGSDEGRAESEAAIEGSGAVQSPQEGRKPGI